MKIKEGLLKFKNSKDYRIIMALLWTTIILFIYFYFGSFSAFEKYFPNTQDLSYWKIIYHNVMSFVLFFGLGLLFSKFILGNKFREMGLGKGQHKLGLIMAGIATVIVPLLALSTLLDSGMTSTYPLINFATYSQWYYIAGYFLSYLLYYIGWEFLFRSILLFSSEDKGIWVAILITTMVSALVHSSIAGFGKPLVETLSSIPAGIIFGWLTIKTRSIWYSLYIHCLVGFLTDIFIFVIL
jgi:membrane protease YdiL (CAAX protease family)